MSSSPSPSSPWQRLDRQLCFALYSASLAMTKLYKPLLDPMGLTYPQYVALLALWEQDGQTVSALGERLRLDSGTLTPLLQRMERAGWLSRVRDTTDERRVGIHLTEAGRALRERAADIPSQVACATACDLDELSRLTTRLQQLRDQISRPLPRAA